MLVCLLLHITAEERVYGALRQGWSTCLCKYIEQLVVNMGWMQGGCKASVYQMAITKDTETFVCVRVCVCACVRVCVRARVCVCMHACVFTVFLNCSHTFFESMPRFLKTLNTNPKTTHTKCKTLYISCKRQLCFQNSIMSISDS